MKAIKKIGILFLSLVTFYACNDDQLNVDNWDGNTVEGGLLDVKNTAMNYVVGNPGPYTANVRVYQGAVKTTSIRVSKTFYTTETVVDPITGEEEKVVLKSNTVDNFKTIAISDTDQNSLFAYTFSITLLVIWEFYEFFIDTVTFNLENAETRNMQRYQWVNESLRFPQDYGLYDTMIDLWVGALGALVVVVVGYLLIRKKQSIFCVFFNFFFF